MLLFLVQVRQKYYAPQDQPDPTHIANADVMFWVYSLSMLMVLMFHSHTIFVQDLKHSSVVNQYKLCGRMQDHRKLRTQILQLQTLCKKASNHHANLPLEMYSFTL